MEKIERDWWDPDVYDIEIEDVMARIVQVVDKVDEMVGWINKQEEDKK